MFKFKSIVPAIAIAAVLAVPGFAQAREDGPVTRAQVRADLVQLERAGYNPAADETTYPADIQAAEARVHAQQGVAASSFGGASEGASAAGNSGHSGRLSFLDRIVRPASDANPVDFNRP
ncbi:membrane protein [Caballeronia peredens]|nr:membrane protein [Caballeronia peredens]